MNEGARCRFKIVFAGQYGTGKTLMFKHLMNEKDGATVTIGCDMRVRTWGDSGVTALLCDTTGQERYKSLAPIYFRNASAIIFVYDVTDETSLNALETEWFGIVDWHRRQSEAVGVLVGTHADCVPHQVSCDTHQQFAARHGLTDLGLVSKAKGIDDMFNELMKLTCLRFPAYAPLTERSPFPIAKNDRSSCC
jgi:small GTP-binding protein